MSDANPAVSVVMIVVSRSPPPGPGVGVGGMGVGGVGVDVGPGAPPVPAAHCVPAPLRSHGSGCGAFVASRFPPSGATVGLWHWLRLLRSSFLV
jgi:hypothetical protein